MRASILIPAHNRFAYTRDCLDATLPELSRDDEVLLIDDVSSDRTPELAERPGVRYFRQAERGGFARAINRGAEEARGSLLVLLNNDTIPQEGWLEAMVRASEEPDVGIVGARLIYPGTHLVQHAGMVFGADLLPYHIYRYHDAGEAHVNRARRFQCVTGACLAVHSELFEAVGGLDEGYMNGVEDVDLCLAIGALGYDCLYEPRATVLHYEGITDGRFDHTHDNIARFARKWSGRVERDDVEVESEDRELLSSGRSS